MTSKAIFYFSSTGNTRAIFENVEGFDIYDVETCNDEYKNYDIIIVGMPTYGRGTPHRKTWDFLRHFLQIKDKKIGLFGSGNTVYSTYCGALDVLEDNLKNNNEILFKFGFEAYPLDEVKLEFEKIMSKIGEM